jgi:hypothetical protein
MFLLLLVSQIRIIKRIVIVLDFLFLFRIAFPENQIVGNNSRGFLQRQKVIGIY